MGASPQEFYRSPGPITELRSCAGLARELPTDVPAIRDLVQGLLIHVFWAERYGVKLSEKRKAEVNLRRVDRQLARLLEIDPSPLTHPRPPERRLVGNCRDFSTIMAAILRAKGIPARARCGFATYFLPNHFEDHWICEHWDAGRGCWTAVDAQLDAFQARVLGIDFDPLDVPPDRFLSGGAAWGLCRSGRADPERFGIFDMHGLWFVRGDLIRDFLSLNKIELLPWDGGWGHLAASDVEMTQEENALMDRIAQLTQAGDEAFEEVRSLFANDPGFHPPVELMT